MTVHKKKALIITTIGGFIFVFEKRNVKMLQELGYEVHYASNLDEKVYNFDAAEFDKIGVKAHNVAIAKSPFLVKQNKAALNKIIQIINEENIDLIHCHTPVGGVLGRLAGKKCENKNIKVVYTAHGFHFFRGGKKLKNFAFKTAETKLARYTDSIVLINKEDYDSACKFKLKEDGKVFQIPGCGLDRDKFKPIDPEKRKTLRAELGISDDQICLFSVGELNQNKNHIVILDMLVHMRNKGKDLSKYKYIICGNGFFKDDLPVWIKERGLEDIVIPYGYCDNVEELVGIADVFFFPSYREGMGMAALEALSCEVPVIAADNRGSREYMIDGVNGFVCKTNTPEEYAKHLEKIEALPRTKYKEMRFNARESVLKFDKSATDIVMRKVYANIDKKVEAGLL